MIALPGRAAHAALPAAIIMAIIPAAAFAQPAPTYAQLLRDTQDAPRLAESAADVARARGLADQAKARPNPNISVVTENVLGGAPYSAFDRAETAVQYNQPFELGGKRRARIAAGEAGVASAEARARETRVAFAYDLARVYAGAEIADRRVALAEEALRNADADLKATRALVEAGRDARLRAVQAESAASAADADLEAARAERVAAYARLSALAGVKTPFSSLSQSLLTVATDNTKAGPIDAASSPAYRAAEAEVVAAGRRVESERRRTIPDVTGSIGVRRLEGDRANALVAGVSLPLRLFDRNRGNNNAAAAEARSAEARLAGLRNDLSATARAADAQVAAARARVSAAGKALDTARENYRLARIAYEAGKSPLVELLNARQMLVQARGGVLAADTARFDLLAGLARLQGRTVTGDLIQ